MKKYLLEFSYAMVIELNNLKELAKVRQEIKELRNKNKANQSIYLSEVAQ